MKIVINIISLYSPGKRISNLWKMLGYLIEAGKYDINAVLQNYPKALVDDIIGYGVNVQECKPKNCEHARNVFLKEFYKSDYDAVIFLDDDILLEKEPRTPHKNIIKYLVAQLNHYPDCALYSLDDDLYSWRYLKNPHIKKRSDFWGGCCIMRNLKRIYGEEIYFSEDLIALGEIDFACKMRRKNLITLFDRGYCAFCQLPYKYSTYGGVSGRNAKNKLARKELVKRNSDFLSLTKDGKLRGMTIK